MSGLVTKGVSLSTLEARLAEACRQIRGDRPLKEAVGSFRPLLPKLAGFWEGEVLEVLGWGLASFDKGDLESVLEMLRVRVANALSGPDERVCRHDYVVCQLMGQILTKLVNEGGRSLAEQALLTVTLALKQGAIES